MSYESKSLFYKIYNLFFSAISTIDECTSLHERWRQYHRQWFFSSQTDADQKLVLADEIFRKNRINGHSYHPHNNDEAYPQRNLR